MTGTSFPIGSSGRVWFDSNDDGNWDSGEPYVSITTTSGGALPAGVTLTVPTVPRGTYDVQVAVPYDTTPDASAPFVVTPEVTLSASSGNVGDTRTVSGSGFKASSTVTIYYDGNSVGTDTTDAAGTFTGFTFTVPSSTRGTHKVKAKDSVGYSPEVNFTILEASAGCIQSPATRGLRGYMMTTSSPVMICFIFSMPSLLSLMN